MITVQTAQGAIQATGNHPFYVMRGARLSFRPQTEDVPESEQDIPGQGRWVNARDLRVGDLLRSKVNGEITITGLSSRFLRTEVYNLEIEECRNYAVHHTGILVHNKSPYILRVYDFEGDVMEQTNKEYMGLHPSFHMVREVESNISAYYPKLHVMLAAGDIPDVVMFHSGPRQWEYAEYQMALDEYIEGWRDEIPEEVWTWNRKDGNPDNPVQMVPLTRQGVGVYYNKTNLRKAGLDPEKDYKVWSEFLDACENLKNAGITPIRYCNPLTGNIALELLWGTLIGNEIQKLFEPGQANFRDPRVRRGVEYLLELKTRGYFDEKQILQDDFSKARQTFGNGEGGFFLGLLSNAANWKEFSDAFGAENCGYFSNWILPESVIEYAQLVDLGQFGFSIMYDCKVPEQAAGYLRMWAVGDGAKNLLVHGSVPASAQQHIDVIRFEYPAAVEVISAVSSGPVVFPLWNYLPDALIYSDLSHYVERLISTGEIDIDEFIDGIQSRLEEYF